MNNLPHPFDRDYPGLIFMAEYSVCTQATNVFIIRRKFEGGGLAGTEVARLEWDEHELGHIMEPTIVCRDRDNIRDTNQLQHLFNALWDLGMRPARHDPSGVVIAAKDANLHDLRTILFSQLGIEL